MGMDALCGARAVTAEAPPIVVEYFQPASEKVVVVDMAVGIPRSQWQTVENRRNPEIQGKQFYDCLVRRPSRN